MENRPTQAETGASPGLFPELIHVTAETAAGVTKEVIKESLPPELEQGIEAYAGMFKFLEGREVHAPSEAAENKEELKKVRQLLAEFTTGKNININTETAPAQPIGKAIIPHSLPTA
jgi:hypothetical protein